MEHCVILAVNCQRESFWTSTWFFHRVQKYSQTSRWDRLSGQRHWKDWILGQGLCGKVKQAGSLPIALRAIDTHTFWVAFKKVKFHSLSITLEKLLVVPFLDRHKNLLQNLSMFIFLMFSRSTFLNVVS